MKDDERWKLLVATSDVSEANLVKNSLQSEGFACRIESRRDYPGHEHGGRTEEVRVYVLLKDFEACQQVLMDEDLEEER